MVSVPRIVVLILVMVVALSCHRLLAQELPVYTTATLPDGSTESVYQLTPGQPTAFEVPQTSTERWKRYRLCTWDRRWFALPIEADGYYVLCGAVRKFEKGQPYYEERNVLGVYDQLTDITQPGIRYSDVIKFPLARKAPDIYVWRAQAGQLWATQLVMHSSRGCHYSIGADKASVLKAGASIHGHISAQFPVALFELDTVVGSRYEFTLNTDESVSLFRLIEASPTAMRVVSSLNPVAAEYQVPIADVFTAEPDTKYLAMVLLTEGEGDYELHFRQREASQGPAVGQIIKDDDGEQDSHWGQVSGGNQVLYKQIVLDEDPGDIRQAVIQYRMGYDPYDWTSGESFGSAPADKQWPDLEISLNDHLVLKRSFDEVARAGWYEFCVDPAFLKEGVNIISFTAESGGRACYYLGIDLDSDYGRSYCALDGQVLENELRPCITCNHHVFRPGEYMVRLKYLTK